MSRTSVPSVNLLGTIGFFVSENSSLYEFNIAWLALYHNVSHTEFYGCDSSRARPRQRVKQHSTLPARYV